MTKENKKKIFGLLSEVTGHTADLLAALHGDTPLKDFGLTSIAFIQFVVALEDEFGIEVLDSDLDFGKFSTVNALFGTLEKYFSKNTLKKVLVCDCDNVLWRGISGEEPTVIDAAADAVQNELLRLYNAGVLLCICSRNQPGNISAAFRQPGMTLKREHILISKVSGNDKPSALREIAAELNLSPDSFVFVDDSDYEIGLVSALIPEIAVIRADADDPELCAKIDSCFEGADSDIDRTKQYRDQKEREKEKLRCKSVEEYNNSLESRVETSLCSEEDAPRVAELSQRTNQFNLSGARYTEDDVRRFIASDEYRVLSLRASDKYGDMGIVGAAVVRLADSPVIEGFFISCRVFGRGFENLLLDEVKRVSPNAGGTYRRTDKNAQFENFYTENGVTVHD